MARITIEIDTTTESVEEVLRSLVVSKEIQQAPSIPNPRPLVESDKLAVLITSNDKKVDEPPVDLNSIPAEAVDTLDADGLPWDERIHSGGKSQTAKGLWKKRKGVGKDTVEQVTAELLALATPTVVATPPPPAPPAPAPDAPTPPPPAPPAASDDAWDWPTLLKALTLARQAKAVTAEQVNAALAAVGLGENEFAILATKQDAFSQFASQLGLSK